MENQQGCVQETQDKQTSGWSKTKTQAKQAQDAGVMSLIRPTLIQNTRKPVALKLVSNMKYLQMCNNFQYLKLKPGPVSPSSLTADI